MKLLLVLGSDDNYNTIRQNINSLGFEMIRYRHVLKAMDNIDEVDPSAIIISARDFPRHWKILVHFIRNEYSQDACPIIILKGENFSTEEISKAFFLGANGVVPDTLENHENFDCLKNVLGNFVPARKGQKRRFYVEHWHRIGLLLADFSEKFLAAADVKTISANGLTFSPVQPMPEEMAALNKEYNECSLRIGDAILSPHCRITENGKTISLEFISFPGGEQAVLNRYLEEFSPQETAIET